MTCIFKTDGCSFVDQALSTHLTTRRGREWNWKESERLPVDHRDSPSTSECSSREVSDLMRGDDNQKCPVKCTWAWKRDLFAVQSPFLMETQVERLNREKDGIIAVSAQRKRKRKTKALLCDHEQKVTELISKLLPDLISRAQQFNYLIATNGNIVDNNKASRLAAQASGPGDFFQHQCQSFDDAEWLPQQTQKGSGQSDPIIVWTDDQELKASSIVGRCVHHQCPVARWIFIDKMSFLIPSCSSFFTSSYNYFVNEGYLQVKDDAGYDLIVIDPPWKNKSVKRKKSYCTLEESDLKLLPLSELASENGLVCVWVPPNARLLQFVREDVFSGWQVKWIADWIWLKLTQCGEPVYDLTSPGKKTYEYLVIGKLQLSQRAEVNHLDSQEDSSKSTDHGQTTQLDIPTDFVFASVPCALHSKKPTLKDLLREYLPGQPKCLELFARNLQPHWTSWGNEPLLHQHSDYYEEVK